MKIYNVGLIGRGKMSKAFQKEIKKTNKYSIIKIISKRDIVNKKQQIKKFFENDKCDLIIITSPLSSHFKYLSLAIKNKKNIIVEKPLVENLIELKKIYSLSRNFKKKIMIHHNDVLNFEKFKILMNDYKKLNKIEMIYGKKEIINSYKKPFFDWLPHPLALMVKYFGYPKKFNIIKFSKKKYLNIILEDLKIEFLFLIQRKLKKIVGIPVLFMGISIMKILNLKNYFHLKNVSTQIFHLEIILIKNLMPINQVVEYFTLTIIIFYFQLVSIEVDFLLKKKIVLMEK